MIAKRAVSRLLLFVGVSFALFGSSTLGPRPAAAGDLANARLLIAGSRLTVSPESQTVPFDTPTIVDTHIEGYDASQGVLPKDLRVLADFTGPEVDGILVLETVPNQPFRIPRLRLQGEYRLDNIRLVQGDGLLAYAEPRSAAVLVTQVLITKVTSRALTLDEIRSYGIVVDDDSFQAFNFTFAFAVAGETVNYNLPVVYFGPGKDQQAILWDHMNYEAPPWQATSQRFEPPRMAPFQLQLEADEGGDNSYGGCLDPEGDCTKNDVVPIPGVIMFPTDVSLLHQFFSVMLIAQNGAPAGDKLQIHDLTARVTLPPGLRQAKTEPPTPLGVPVPVRVPGPDGKLGTGDDLTFLVAQASGQAEVLVEGLREGTHIVKFDLEGVLTGLADGQIRRITGQAQGAVIVRDPTLNVTITHPDVVRTDEEYSLLLTVTNTGTAPANLLKVKLPLEKLSGAEVVGENEKTVTILPGDAELLEFRLRSKRTGRVVASAVRSSGQIVPTFELTVGVGENGIPLSPSSIILPKSADILPADLLRNSLNLVGLGFSLATAPPSLLRSDLPRVSRSMVDNRVYQLAQAGRHVALGEDLFDSAAQLAAEWTGAREADWEWDLLRRTTQKGARVGASLGAVFAAEASATSPKAAFDRFAKTTGYLPVMDGALATGAGVTLEIASRTGGQRLLGGGNDATRLRELPFADLFVLNGSSQMALMAVPEEAGYTARIRAAANVSAGLHVLVPGTNGALRMVRWENVSLSAGGTATVEFRAADSSFTLAVDTQGDGTVDDQIPGTVQTLERRPFQALGAALNLEVDPTGHVVDILFTSDVDWRALYPRDPRHFVIPGKVSDGANVPTEDDVLDANLNTVQNFFKGLRNSRIVRVTFNNPLSPYVAQNLTVSAVKNPLGEQVASATIQVRIPANAQPGTLVEGKVYGPDGKPVPFAEVVLREGDPCLLCEEGCRTHKTAIVRADAQGSFLFDYVRQTACSDVYQLKATDSASGYSGSATGRVRFIGNRVQLDILMLGRGTIRGKVTYEDGTVPADARVIAESPVFREGRGASIDANGNYSVAEVPVGTITLSANDGQGRFVVKTVEVPAAGSVVDHDLVILRLPPKPPTNGEVRGKILRPDGTTPVSGAYVALYVDGNLIGTQRSGSDGAFDFGIVPAGRGEIETFEGETGQSGVQVFFELKPDQVNTVNLVMRDQRGVVQGYVYKQQNGTTTPMFGVIVWAEGTPFKTVTNEAGFYRLEGVYAGTRNVSAADLEKKVKLSETVTIGTEGQVVDRNFYFQGVSTVGGIAGEVLGFDGSPVPGATVHLAASDQQWYRTATTNSSGRFTIPDLGPGSYGVHAFKGSAGGRTTATIRFTGDTPFATIRFKRGTIHGTVRAENDSGQPVGITAIVTYRTTAVRFELVGLDAESHNVTTNADGTYEIPDVLVGPYVLTVTNAFYGSKTVRSELVENGEVHTQDFLFERNLTGTIRGRVLSYDGVTPVQGATVKLHHPNFSDYDKTTDADGRFSFELVPPTGWAFPIEAVTDNGVVFRKAESWVRFNQRGQELDVDVVLPKQGSVSGRVTDANGVAIPGSIVTLQEGSYPRRNLVVNADAGGNFEFHNVFAGVVTLSARAPSLGGLGGKTTVEIKQEGEEVAGVTIFLEPTGKIQGRVTSPADGSAAASSEVRLYRWGYFFDVVNADAEGRFEFNLLPLAEYAVVAFDPRTGRHGRKVGLRVESNNQIVPGDVVLEARGIVDGHLYEPSSTVAIPGATVRLGVSSIAGFTTYSSTGPDGLFEFLGIPQGTFDLFSREPGGRRVANGRGEIVSEGQRVTVDLFLEKQGTVKGSVLNPLGAPDGIFPNANTLIWQDGQIIGATLDSQYQFNGVILGHDFNVSSSEVGGQHRTDRWGRLNDTAPLTFDVRMHPLGSVVVDVHDSFGNPVSAAAVEVNNDGYYGFKRFAGDTGTDNSITFQNAGEGWVAAYARNPLNGLRGSASARLTQDGEIVHIDVKLENSGEIKGVVVGPDGTTPSVSARVYLQIAGRTLTTTTDEAGAFSLPSVPMGGFLLAIQEAFGPANREIRGSLTTNGQVIDLGTVVLDDADPKVVEVAPPTGTVDAPLNTTALVRFSEPIDKTRDAATNMVHLETSYGSWVSATATWLDGDTALRITPNQPLQNFTTYRIKVSANIFDRAGRRLTDAVQTSFTTVDVLPPVVIESSPANNAKQVPLAAQIRLTFNEPVDFFSLSGNHMQLRDVTAGADLSTTFQLDTAGRTVTINPVVALTDGHVFQVTVNGVADRVGNVMVVPFTSTFYSLDTTPPTISDVLPAEGATFTSGDRMTVSLTATDPAGVTGVALRIGRWVLVDNQAPFSWNVPVPVVTAAGDAALELEATDSWGNRVAAVRTIHVQPRSNTHPPQVDLGCFGGRVVPGAAIDIPYHATDDENIESYKVLVDGTAIVDVPFVDAASVTSSTPWTVPATAAPGSVITVRMEARDFAGQVASAEVALTVVAGTALAGDRTLADTYAGQTLLLSKGTFTVTGPLHVGSLILRDATLKSAAGGAVALVATGKVEIACGAKIDVSNLGYAGGMASSHNGGAPAGVQAAQGDAGGSHGGGGTLGVRTGPAGAVFDSVYEPGLAGGGGSLRADLSLQKGGLGGGVVRIDAGEVELAGQIRALGESRPWNDGSGGAGGTVWVRTAKLSGAGLVDVSGGNSGGCSEPAGAGGGGRVSLLAQTLSGFDPAAQVRTWGGDRRTCGGGVAAYGAPGTVYVFDSGSTYGRLLVDNGQDSGVDRAAQSTELPVLSQGSVTALAAAGADTWLTAAAPFGREWLGAWVVLKDAAGQPLGTGFKVLEIDGNRLRLAGAAAVTGAASYAGEYRFDALDLRHGAGVRSASLVAVQDVVIQGAAKVSGEISAGTLLVKSGAVVTPASGGNLRFKVTGKMTVEAGAVLDVSNLGYAGGTASSHTGGTPSGVAASLDDAGGSHGGSGSLGVRTGPAGAVYDSVYEPGLGGGGGSLRADLSLQRSGWGGGVVEIDAGELALLGEIRARGESRPWNDGSGGAGGTVRVRTGTLSGAGLIDVSGGGAGGCSEPAGVGGGGRVSLLVQTLSGFDPAAQVKAWGGERQTCGNAVAGYAAPGTIFVSDSTSTYGRLLVDSGQVGTVDRTGLSTELPALGQGSVTALGAAGSDAWLRAASPFSREWLGAWVVLKDAAGVPQGTGFKAVEIDDGGRLRLAGASSVTGAASYAGEYRFDAIDLRHGAGLRGTTPVNGQQVVLQGNATVSGDVTANTVLVKSGAVVSPAAGGNLRFKVTGKMTVEAGARLDVSNLGYVGGTASSHTGGVPSGVVASKDDAGGSHGGSGTLGVRTGPAGAVYDSVYEPGLGGGGGSLRADLSIQRSGWGGGVVEIDAGELELLGEIRARGESRPWNDGSGGAGGTVRVRTGTLSGAGLIDASGGDAGGCAEPAGVGGGGRVSLLTQTLSGFDPAAQVKAWAGERRTCNSSVAGYGAPGTVFVSDSTSTYGRLLVDSGQAGGVDRTGLSTELPALGQGSVAALSASGTDAWLSAASPFSREWLGAWVVLKDAAGVALGTGYKVVEIDGGGRLRLAGAGTVSGAASYTGEYRFDAVDLRHGAGLRSSAPISGQQVVLQGNATVSGDVSAVSVLVKSGAVVTPATGGTLRFKVAGKMTVEAGARLDVSNLGYAGGTASVHNGGAPSGVAASKDDAGGSHGGGGTLGVRTGPAGAVYDSVYEPGLGGGGGSLRSDLSIQKGGWGGGVVEIDAGELELLGEIRARGESRPWNDGSGGAGGTVRVRTGKLSGATGLIDASGGGAGGCSEPAGVGGGGRVSLQTQTVSGFDPAAQVKAWGGERLTCGSAVAGYAAPGTVFVSDSTSTYGRLLVDSGQAGTTDRAGLSTELPTLGQGDVTALVAAGADAWLSAASAFGREWLGAWVVLKDAAGVSLGTGYKAVEVDGGGRLRLAGAGAVSGAVSYAGEYRFDLVDLRHGAGLRSATSILGQRMDLQGAARVSGDVSMDRVVVKSGSVVTPAVGGNLRFKVTGRMTVEANARLDVSNLGYAGGTASSHNGGAPSGVAAAKDDAGGSHGGGGTLGVRTGPAGAVYDSVYEPALAGGGGSLRSDLSIQKGGWGGGVVEIDAGELELLGEIRAQGESRPWNDGSGGAGGTVRVRAGTLLGTGLIDASGGGAGGCSEPAGVGGGGRVSLLVQTLSGFDPAAQVKAWGAERLTCNSAVAGYGAPGTIFVSDSTSTYGRLLVDSGQAGTTDRVGLATELPTLSQGNVAALAASGSDAWLSAASPFGREWLGAWVVLKDAAGVSLGTGFKVAEIDGGGRLRLAGAAAVSGAASYAGEYRFDAVDLRHGAGLRSATPVSGQQVVLQGNARLSGDVTAASVVVKSGAVVVPAVDGNLRFKVSGRMTIEAGARLDVSNLGYAGGTASSHNGGVPSGVVAPKDDAGGSHGGTGTLGVRTGPAGAVYDSVYEPALAGGGGSLRADLSIQKGGWGGGVVEIDAGELELLGEIRARGESRPWNDGSGGAGGTVRVRAGTLSGTTGLIDASGGGAGGCGEPAGGGGGGRVSLQVQTLSGFDPALQVKAWGGDRQLCGNGAVGYGAPGTVYVSDSASTYGRLLLDAGQVNGADRTSLATELPALSPGNVATLTAAGTDAWLSAASPFGREWLGAWVVLKNAAGSALGTGYKAVETDGVRLRLAGASGVTGAASYAGEYRFDKLDVLHGAGLLSASPVTVQTASFAGNAKLTSTLRTTDLTFKAGAVVLPASGGDLQLVATGRLTVEAGARLDVSGKGYAGGDGNHQDGYAPAGVTPAKSRAGGSHGGRSAHTSAGEVYDSVYAPGQWGGGGAYNGGGVSGFGAGAVRIEAGELALAGEIRARGDDHCGYGGGAGAGGTVAIVAGVVSGAGTINASGGDIVCVSGVANSGGGGRVSIVTGTWSGFDPAAQVKALGGLTWGMSTYSAPGTVYYKKAVDTYGALLVDGGRAGSDTVATTVLPSIGKGIVGAVTVQGSDAWIEPQDPAVKLSSGVVGMWVRVNGTDYPVAAQSDDRRRVLLAGAAGAVSVGQAYVGIYKLDTLTVKGRATLQLLDGAVLGNSTVASGSTLTLYDLTPPTVTVTQPAAGTVYTPGQTVAITAAVTDDRGVASVTFRLGDQSFVDTASPYQWSVAAPAVETEGDVPIVIEAVDTNDNHTVVNHSIHLRPLAPGAAPVVAFTCPTLGALLAPGTGIDLNVAASHDNGIERVEFLSGTTVLSTDFSAPFTYRFTAPAGATDGQVLTVTARAKSFSNTTADATFDLRVVQGTVITADRSVTAADTSLDNVSVIVAGGTLTVTGPHTFRDLVVLDGANVSHPETTSTVESKLDLTVQRDVYVACGGSVDVTGRGFLGSSSSSSRAYGFGNAVTEGADPGVGGSYGGRGGQYNGSGPVYGSFYDPRDSGAGGGYSGAKGRDGGGIVRITATGNAVIDGTVLANGETGASGAGGAGGSIRVNAAAVRGAGSIQASGSAGAGGTAGGGSGGRIALYAASIDSGLAGRTVAAGAKTSSTDPLTWGAAGTVFLKPDAQALGDLILDNAGTASSQYTELLTVGSGVIDAVSANGFTDNEADFHSFLGAAEVAFNGNLGTLYTVTGHSHHGTTLTLNVPTPPLSDAVHAGDTYQGVYRFNSVTVRNGARGIALDRVLSGNTPGTGWTESYAPSIQITSPAAGASYTAGTNFTMTADPQDVLGIKSVTFQFNGQTQVDTTAPYSWAVAAPAVPQATNLDITAQATDLSGNRFGVVRTIQVQPAVDPNAPVVTLTGCQANGDFVAPGTALTIPFTVTDDQSIQSYSLVVDGVTQQTVTPNVPSVTASFIWTPPAGAAAGTAFNVRVEARDFGNGVGFAALTLTVPPVTPLTGTQNLTSARNGQAVYLGAGTFTVTEPLSPASLVLMNGAKVVGLSGQTLKLTASGAVRVQCGGLFDVSNLGYAGGVNNSSPGGAPSGVAASAADAGGSHGGVGQLGELTGPAGDTFDSVYEPQLGGGGGSLRYASGGRRGGNGGGVLVIEAGELVVGGEIRAQGEKRQVDGSSDSSGAGGSILITAQTLSGTGLIDASGADYRYWNYWGGSGGGGRVALYVNTFTGFDPAAQVRARGGALLNGSNAVLRYAGPGTVFVKQTGDTYGRLIVDSGEETGGIDRVGLQSPLPLLGTGAVTGFEVSGSDAWVAAAAAFKASWVGAFMVLKDAAGTSLGTFRVVRLDASGRALLASAGSLSGAATYSGQYRFDRVDLKNGAGLSSVDDLVVGDVVADGATRLPKLFTAANLTLKSGAVATPAVGGELRATVSGTLTLESGARLDVSTLGYAGGVNNSSPGGAPSGVVASAADAGGSHGGVGQVGELTGPAGDTFGSVYQPELGGGGGSLRYASGGRRGGNGGGAVVLNVGSLRLDGEIRSQGEKRQVDGSSDSSGAGGSVLIVAQSMSGTGLIDASGADYRYWNYWGGSGGGGRVALYVDTFTGFDPAAQVRVWGGTLFNNATVVRYAGPGTVYVKQPSETYGRLIVDSGKSATNVDRLGLVTPLPVLGTGSVTVFEVSGADAWVTAAAPFKVQWGGAWMALKDSAGNSLGSFRVVKLDAAGRALLAGAGSVTGAAQYTGQYRFDRVDLRSGAGLSSQDEVVVGDVYADGGARLPKLFTAANVTLKAGAVAIPAVGGELRATVSGRLTIESGARLDVSNLGYPGGLTNNALGGAPTGVTGSAADAGGSHGGVGQVGELAGPAGDTFGSVYQPELGGGGGSLRYASGGRWGGAGGGVVALNVGELVLNGEIRARGEKRQVDGSSDSSGAGGSVLIVAQSMNGTGLIDASGADYRYWNYWGGSGGGGRVALYVNTFTGFDPAAQVRVWGGTLLNNATIVRYAGPGTVYVKQPSETYGRLIVDSGEEANGTDRTGLVTPLPLLGTGAVAGFEASGSDAWVTAAAPFKVQWTGAWMALKDGSGASLGSFRVVKLDAAGRVLLAGAASVSGAATYTGQYRFDRVDLKNGSGLSSQDDFVVGDVFADGAARLPKLFSAANVTLKTGAVVTPAVGGELRAGISGTMTIETGARLDVSALGYAGPSTGSTAGGVPSGVTPSSPDAGGSHGGAGRVGNQAGPAGEVFDSVYQPQLGGGGGSLLYASGGRRGGNGGGVVVLNVGTLLLNGEIRAKGEQRQNDGSSDASGAGGTVSITGTTLSGTGLIDASGGAYRYWNYWAGSGGGGRVALYVDTFSGFDPATQVKVRGGALINGNSGNHSWASPGTLYVKQTSQTYGKLYVDQGGTSGLAIPNTLLPSVGVGTIGTATADAQTPANLWIEPSDPAARFALGAVGMWVRVNGNDYRVLAQTTDRRKLLLEGAAGIVDGGAGYRGVYKFDEVIVRGGSKLELRDTNVVGTFTVDSTSTVIQNVP